MGDAACCSRRSTVYADVLSNPAANHEFAEFFRNKIRSIVDDPQTAADLCPTDHPIATKRPCLDTNYYATYNLPHVRLVNVRKHPIRQVTETGIDTADESFTLDAIVFATGFDAVTGAITAVDIRGRNDLALKDKWANGPQTYLGLTTVGFPNLFFITGPGSPSVLSNMAVSIEQHVDWVLDCLGHLSARGFDVIEPTETAEAGWTQHVNDCADITLYPAANSWYMGANVPGKPRVFLPYCAGVDFYRASCDEVVARDYLGFRLSGPNGSQCNDGVVRRLQPDVEMVLMEMAAMNLPTMESMAVAGRPRVLHADAGGATAGARRRRDRRRCPARRHRRSGVPALPAADAWPAPGRRVLPRRGLGCGRRDFGRSAVPGPLCAQRRNRHLGGLPPRARAPIPRRGRRRHGRGAVGRRQCRGARRPTRPTRGVWLECGRRTRGGGLPARARHGWTQPRRAGVVDAADGRRHGTRAPSSKMRTATV